MRDHRFEHLGVGFFLDGNFAKDLSGVGVVAEHVLLGIVFGGVAILGGFHPPDGGFGAEQMIEESAKAVGCAVAKRGRRGPQFRKFGRPAIGMTVLRLGHADQNVAALFTFFSLGQLAVNASRVFFGQPVAAKNTNGLGRITRGSCGLTRSGRWWRFHRTPLYARTCK